MRKIRSLLFSLPVLCCVYSACGAGGAGTQGGQFLRISPDARSAALGATASVSQGGVSVFQNPAGLAEVERFEAGLSQVTWLESINYSNVSTAFRTGRGVFGFGLNYLSVPAIIKYDNTGTPQDTSYSPSDTAVTMGYGFNASRAFQAGVNIKYISSSIDDASATAFAADAGCQLNIEDAYLCAGLLVQNTGTEIKFAGSPDPLPAGVRLGLAYFPPIISEMDEFFDIDERVLFIAEANYISPSQAAGNFGLEFKRVFDETDEVSLRTGYTSNIKGLGSTGITLGLGIVYSSFTLDYAFVPYEDLGDTHRITVGYKL
jgi:hypothetical protein